MFARAAYAVLVVAFLAGCSDAPKADAPTGTSDPDCVTDCLPVPLDGASSVAAPVWAIGQWWEWQVSFAGEDLPDTFTSVVVGTTGAGSLVATDHPTRAKDEAAFDVLLLGEVGPSLKMTRAGADWDLFSFPLTDGKTWQATIPNIAWDVLLPAETVTLDLRAVFEADLPGYRVMGHAGDAMLLDFTYLPEAGWFGDFKVFDIDEGDDPEEFRMRAVKSGLNYTGTYYIDTATLVVDMYDASGLDNPPPEGQPVLNVDPRVGFSVGADVASLFGFVEIVAVVGDREVVIAPPGGAPPLHYQATGDIDGAEGFWDIDLSAVAGDWEVATTGAGGHSAAFVQIFSITEATATM